MLVELDDAQRSELRALLDVTLRDLSYEIASADLPSFRLMLRRRRETLGSVLDALGGRLTAAERSG
jgi:hypothetical protein